MTTGTASTQCRQGEIQLKEPQNEFHYIMWGDTQPKAEPDQRSIPEVKLGHIHSAVYINRFTGNIGRLSRCQKGNHIGNILWITQFIQWYL